MDVEKKKTGNNPSPRPKNQRIKKVNHKRVIQGKHTEKENP